MNLSSIIFNQFIPLSQFWTDVVRCFSRLISVNGVSYSMSMLLIVIFFFIFRVSYDRIDDQKRPINIEISGQSLV